MQNPGILAEYAVLTRELAKAQRRASQLVAEIHGKNREIAGLQAQLASLQRRPIKKPQRQ